MYLCKVKIQSDDIINLHQSLPFCMNPNSSVDIYALAEKFVEQTACPVFLTGKAGTGKTTFLKHLREHTQKQMAVIAPTGVAAINAGGVTIHSFFQLPFTPFAPIPQGRKNLIAKSKLTTVRRKVLQELELLVIDEISMVRADLLDAVDTMLRHFRYRANEPFGGVQVVYIGDMYQLSPVVPDEEWQLLSQFYEGPYFFQSKVVRQQPPVFIELDRIFRQTNEQFISLLNEVRNNCLTEAGEQCLNSRYIADFRPSNEDGYITLTTHNAKADRINYEELDKIDRDIFYFDAQVQGDFPEKSFPNDERLKLKKGARVMFIANDMETPRRYYNGKIGVVTDIDEEHIRVKTDPDDEPIEVKRETWQNIHYTVNKETNQIEEHKLGSYTQYPLRLAWAITIHKSQGLTFDRVVIDAQAAFAPGQIYVALSRCRSLEGIVLSSPLNTQALQVDRHIVRYVQQKPSARELEAQINVFKERYNEQVLFDIFNFSDMVYEMRRFYEQTVNEKNAFNDETLPFISRMMDQTDRLNRVTTTFRKQLQYLLHTSDTQRTNERIRAASDYFATHLTSLIAEGEKSPARTDSRASARDYNDALTTILTRLAYKKHLIGGIGDGFSITRYFELKATFTAPPGPVNAYAAAHKELKTETEHQELFRLLAGLRKELCEETGAPAYLVAATKTLIELCNMRPQTPEELMGVKGFGKIKTQKYGDRFLEIINEYCRKYGLSSLIDPSDHTKKRKRRKIDS